MSKAAESKNPDPRALHMLVAGMNKIISHEESSLSRLYNMRDTRRRKLDALMYEIKLLNEDIDLHES